MRNALVLPDYERKGAPFHRRWAPGSICPALRHFGSTRYFARSDPVLAPPRSVRLRATSSNRRCRLRADARSRAADRVAASAVLVAWALASFAVDDYRHLSSEGRGEM